MPKPCTHPSCERPILAKGLCAAHYHVARLADPGLPRCSVSGCETAATDRGYCRKHYQRFRSNGDPTKLIRRERGTGFVSYHGYRGVRIKGVVQWEHRNTWEKANGPIPNGMDVHHRNGDKLDNRIENLELLSRSAHMRLHRPKDLSPCSVPECGHTVMARTLCSKHYQAWRAHRPDGPQCTIRGCTRPATASNLCNTHYAAARRESLND